jgi:hypothetical protein
LFPYLQLGTGDRLSNFSLEPSAKHVKGHGSEGASGGGRRSPGWKYTAGGTLMDEQPQADNCVAFFKHVDYPFFSGDVLKCTVRQIGKIAAVGFSGAELDIEGHSEAESTAWVELVSGGTHIKPGLALDGETYHYHAKHLAQHIPKQIPFDLALRCEAGSNVTQAQFNNDGAWHDFAPAHWKDKEVPSLNRDGPLFPYLQLGTGDRLSNFSLEPSAKHVKGHGSEGASGAGSSATSPFSAEPGSSMRIEEWVDASFQDWPGEKRALLSHAFKEEEYFSISALVEMDEDEAAAIVAAASLKTGSAKVFKNALAELSSNMEAINLIIVTVTGRSAVVKARLGDTVQSVKEKAKSAGVAGENHALAHGKEQLTDEGATLAQYCIKDNSTLHVLPATVGTI